MNPYSFLDAETLGQVAAAKVDPTMQLSAYPTYPNAAGLGSQTAGQQAQQPQQNPVTAATNKIEVPDTTSRGMSPYSLIGDANYRQR
jgi:hypothetical protein